MTFLLTHFLPEKSSLLQRRFQLQNQSSSTEIDWRERVGERDEIRLINKGSVLMNDDYILFRTKIMIVVGFTAKMVVSLLVLSSGVTAFAPTPASSLSCWAHHRGKLFLGDDNSGSDLFPAKGSSYVPSGLSPQEYAKIKKQEQDELSTMNFGAFGPRFHNMDRPKGDWMILPRLWTHGFGIPSSAASASEANSKLLLSSSLISSNQDRSVGIHRVYAIVKTYAIPFLFSYILLDSLVTGAAMFRAVQTKVRHVPLMVIRFLLWKRKNPIGLPQAMMIVQCIKILLASSLAYPAKECMELIQQRWHWSPKRFLATFSISAFGLLTGWGWLLIAIYR